MEIMQNGKKINGGLYLVVDPCSFQLNVLLDKINQALEGGVDIIQIWDHFQTNMHKEKIVDYICNKADKFSVPVVINNDTKLLKRTKAAGVHFDTKPEEFNNWYAKNRDQYIVGITCSNDLSIVEWAHRKQLDYISFCSMFPSSSTDSCDIVTKETIKMAREITNLPIFLAGGINTSNISSLSELKHNGIALISGIMNAENIIATSKKFRQIINKINENNND